MFLLELDPIIHRRGILDVFKMNRARRRQIPLPARHVGMRLLSPRHRQVRKQDRLPEHLPPGLVLPDDGERRLVVVLREHGVLLDDFGPAALAVEGLAGRLPLLEVVGDPGLPGVGFAGAGDVEGLGELLHPGHGWVLGELVPTLGVGDEDWGGELRHDDDTWVCRFDFSGMDYSFCVMKLEGVTKMGKHSVSIRGTYTSPGLPERARFVVRGGIILVD